MKLLFDFFPIVLFFVFFKWMGIYTATIVTILASILQVLICWLKNRRVDNVYKLTLVFVVVLGGATLFFHDPMFIKWKPTVVYWLSASALLFNRFFGRSNYLEKLLGKNMQLSLQAWNYLSLSWTVFLFIMGVANLYIAYSFDTDTWVNFKFFGGLGLTAVFVLIQAIYLSRYAHFTFGDTQR